MQVQVDLEYNQLLRIVRNLPAGKLRQLKEELSEKTNLNITDTSDTLESLLLSGPTATKKQLSIIASNRKAINQWRTI